MNGLGSSLHVVVVGHDEAEMGDVGGQLADELPTATVATVGADATLSERQLGDAELVVVVDDPPASDGVALFRRVRDAEPTVPVVVATDGSDTTRLETVLAAGVTDAVSLAQPAGIERLAARIRGRLSTPVDDGTAVAERWSDIASALSHDVKNPMNVLVGRIELVEMDPVHQDAMNRSLDRTLALLDDLSTLGTVARPVSTTDSVEVAPIALRIWETLDTGDATLEVADGWTLMADSDRLEVVLTRLFENAIIHGGADVTVSVEQTPEGFTVSDDGPGIAEAERTKVLQQGYGTTTDGEGYGLFVAATAVEAHGWTIEVSESDPGGTRIEIITTDITSEPE